MKNHGKLGRHQCNISKIKDGKYLSKTIGMRETKEINIYGRIYPDIYTRMQKDHKPSSYSPNIASLKFIGD